MPMSYTGQASIVMRLKGFPTARSIHSSLYQLVKAKAGFGDPVSDPFHIYNTEFNTTKYVYNFLPIPIEAIPNSVRLFIVDEGYMVPLSMKHTILKYGRKVLVAGDDGQLPPISGEPAFLTGYNIHRLTQIMRQKENDPIIYLAHRARRGDLIHCGAYGNNVIVIDESDLTKDMIMNVGNIICGTNKSRDYFNNYIRTNQNKDVLPTYGDRVICRNNNWNISIDNIALANGLSGYITSPITVDRFDNSKGLFRMDFLPDLLYTPFTDLKVNYKYIMSDYATRNEIKNNRFTNGELFEYAYAITTHLSQGAEYPAGIYYEEFLRPNIQNALNYTGITRFREAMIYVKKSRKFY